MAQDTPPPEARSVLLREFVYEKAPFAECHAGTLIETPTGLLSAWFGGTEEKDPDVGIWVSRRDGGPWTPPVEVANGIQHHWQDGRVHRHPCWNPVLHAAANGTVLLFYKCGPDPSNWWGMLTSSPDFGKTWSLPRRLPEGIYGPVKNKPITLANGDILCGTSTEDNGWQVHMERTSNLGATWVRTQPLNDGRQVGAIQPTLLSHRDGRLQILCRDRNGRGRLWQSWSSDAGKTWSAFKASSLPNPNSGVDGVTLRDGRQLLVYNHTHRGGSFPSGREMLNVAVSSDGIHWKAALTLEKERGAEFSYPAVIQTKDGLVHTFYTWKRQKMRHVVIDPARLELREIPGETWPD